MRLQISNIIQFISKRSKCTSSPAMKTSPVKPVKSGIISPCLTVPKHIPKPYYCLGIVAQPPPYIPIISQEEIEKLRDACSLAKQVLQYAGTLVEPGRTTDEIDALVHKEIIAHNAYPSPLGYHGFPKSICTSVNNVILHGIPDSRQLEEGDIVTIDVTVYYKGYHGDTCRTFHVGKQRNMLTEKLMKFTESCLLESIHKCCYPKSPFSAIGAYIEDLCNKENYSVLSDYGGHGIGQFFHQLPFISHCRNDNEDQMEAGMVFTVEPMICEGSSDYIEWDDGWTIATADDSNAAQYEHTVLITNNGAEILT